MTAPLVSIKMVTYNHAPFIAQAIEGVLRQKTDFPFELIIGEDCSTDGTREIVFNYREKYPDIIRVVTSEKNVGAKKNGLRTLKAGRGKYIAFCEGDDYWHNPHKLQKQVDYLESHPDCGMVYSSYDVHLVSFGKKIENYLQYRKRNVPGNPTISNLLEGKGMPLTCTVMLRRALYEAIIEADPYLYHSEDFLMGDTQLWVEMTTRARLHYMPESMATYSVIDGSATRSKDRKKAARFSVSSAQLRVYLCDKYNLAPHIRYKNQQYLFDSLLRFAFYTHDGTLADEVRSKKKKFTLSEWVRYFGAKNVIIHYIYRVLALVRNLFRKKHSQWL